MTWIVARTQGLGHLSSSPAFKSTRIIRNHSSNLLLPPLPPLPPSLPHPIILLPIHLPLVTAPSPLAIPCSPILRELMPAFDLSAMPLNSHFVPTARGRNPIVPIVFPWNGRDIILICMSRNHLFTVLVSRTLSPLFSCYPFRSFVAVDLYQTPSSLFSIVFSSPSFVHLPTGFPLHSRDVHEI